MQHLVRTRSQHFVSSPRRMASPMKHNHPSGLRHPLKRRKIGPSAFVPSRAVNVSDSDGADEDDYPPEGSRTRRGMPLTAEAGSQAVNLSRSKSRVKNESAKGKGKTRRDVFSLEDEENESPKKRKRVEREVEENVEEEGVEEDESEADTGSWVEVDEGEEQPEFIAESDQQLLQEAPAHVLHRLRKAELIRLWKVAGMWTTENEDDGEDISAVDDDDDGGLVKKELVDGLIAARRTAAKRSTTPRSSSRESPSHKASLESVPHKKRLRRTVSASASRSPASSESSSSSDNQTRRAHFDADATPRAIPRTKSKLIARLHEAALRSTQKRATRDLPRGKSNRRLSRARSKSMGGEREDRRARFGDDVKSPGKALLREGRNRRSSTQSSAYTTTDTSPPEQPIVTRATPRRNVRKIGTRGYTPARRIRQTPKPIPLEDQDTEMDDSGEEEIEATPLVQRLRSRSNRSSFVKEQSSEVEADAEDDDGDEVEAESEASPGPSSRLRSRDQRTDSGVSNESARRLPGRGRKRKARQEIQDGESDTGEDDDMVVDPDEVNGDEEGLLEDGEDEDAVMSEDEDDPPRPLTRSQLRALGGPPRSSKHDSLASSASSSSDGDDTSLTPLSPEEDEEVRTTRSGRAFGVVQSRRSRLRQEAMDDPDMEVDEDEEDTEEEDDSFGADVDLSRATVASLTRLLRDELVQLCEVRDLEVRGTKPQLARALLAWRDEQQSADGHSVSSEATARPRSSGPKTRRGIIHAIGSNKHVAGKTTPVLLRDHIHVTDPATPPLSDESKPNGEAELNLDLSELGLEDSMIKPNQLIKLEKIGSGGFKDVYVGKFRGRRVAISEFRGHLSEMDIRELKLLAEFSHPNIVKFRGICIPEDSSQIPCMLVSELCENGDLFDYIRNVPPPTLKRVLNLMLDIAHGLDYLHTRKPAIIHRDCKSSNILINRQGQAKVGDFGLARVKTSTRSMIRSLVGTVNWQAPELWHPHPRYDYKVDIFSAALVYWEMLAGWGVGEKKYPWEGHNEHYIYDAVGAKHRRPSTAGMRKHWGAEPVNLLERMWHQDPLERPTMTDVVTDLEALIAECD